MELIRRKLESVKRRIKLLEAGTIGLALITFTLVFFSTEILLDKIFILDRSLRAGALGVLGVVAAAFLTTGVVLAVRRLSDLYAARVLEQHYPWLNQSLMTYVQMHSGDALGSDEALGLIEDRLEESLEKADIGPAVRSRLASRLLASALVVALFLGTSAVVARKGFLTCLDRVLRPYAGTAPPTETRFTDLWPGDAHVLVGAPVNVGVRTQGIAPSEARVFLSYEDGTWFIVPMKKAEGAWEATLPGAQLPYRYFVAAGDTRSDLYKVTPLPPPMIENLSASIRLPAVVRRPSKTVTGGDIECLPESEITLRGKSNRELKSATLVFEDGQRIPFQRFGGMSLVTYVTARRSMSYRIETLDQFGLSNPAPPVFRLEVRPECPPEVAILQPGAIAEILPDQPVELIVEASGDYGIADLVLHFQRRGGVEQRKRLTFDPDKGPRRSYTFAADEFGLMPPDSMLYQIEARDDAAPAHVGWSAIHVLHLRRRPTDEIAPYEPLLKSLNELKLDEALKTKFGIEDLKNAAEERDPARLEAEKKLGELLDKQRDLIEKIRELGSRDDLNKMRDEIREMRRELEKTRSETNDLGVRGASKQERMAESIKSRLETLKQRAEALARRLLPKSNEKESSVARRKALRQAVEKLADAAQRLQWAAQSMGKREDGNSAESQEGADRDLKSAQQTLDEQMAADLSEEERRRAEELARIEKMLREQTEELREQLSPEERERLKKARRSMGDAQRSLEQGNPGPAQDNAEEAMKEMEPQGAQEEPPREVSEEKAKALAEVLTKMCREQEAIRKATAEIQGRRGDQGSLTKEDHDLLPGLAKREDALAEEALEVRRRLEKESAEVFRWSIDAIRNDLLDLRELLEAKVRTDCQVTGLQDSVVSRLKQLIEALKPQTRNGGGGGGGSGKPPRVGFEAQLKMLRALQADLLQRSESIRSKYRDGDEIGAGDRVILGKLFEQQEDLHRLVTDLSEEIKRGGK